MMKPPLILMTSKDCGYQKVFSYQSDANLPGTYNREFCTACESVNIEVTSDVSFFRKTLFDLFGK